MKAQTLELMEVMLLILGISIVLIFAYLFIYRTSEASSQISLETSQYEKVTKLVHSFFYSTLPRIEKTVAQILADRLLSSSDVVYYGEKYGGINATKIIYDYFDSYFEKRWNLTIHVRKDIKNSILWIPNSGIGNSVSKVNAVNALELGRYYTVPASIYGNPSRVAVDSKGNVWVGNRGTRTIVKIGLLENNQCVDKNGNGKIETSFDENQDGMIDSNEIYYFGDDECLLKEVFLGGTTYGNFKSSGIRAVCVDKNDNVYAGIFEEGKLYLISEEGVILNSWVTPVKPYGCFVDDEGIVWISSAADTPNKDILTRFDPSSNTFQTFNISHYVYGIAPCYKEDCLVINGWTDAKLTKFNTTSNKIIFTKNLQELYQGRGVVVDTDNNIYAVSTFNDLIIKFDKNGNKIAEARTCDSPKGVGIDSFEKVWVVCGDSGIRRYTRELREEVKNSFGEDHYVYNYFTSYNLKPIFLEKNLSFGYLPQGERVRTYFIKLPLPLPSIGGIVDVVFTQW